MRKLTNILITGGAGFIGSNFIHYMFGNSNFKGRIINFDKLTYAGNLENLNKIEKLYNGKRYFFVKGDICSSMEVEDVLQKYEIDTIIHFAAESHVDRSITGPGEFMNTNITGTYTLLNAARIYWGSREDVLFHHVSTDEVFGSLGETGFFDEDTSYDPRSPYSASKASSDHLVRSYFHTFRLPVTISNCSNNYGPYQFPEKLIPLIIQNIIDEKPLPIYGDGRYIRDWLFVDDHNSAILNIINNGKTGETYCIGGENEWENIKLVNVLCEKLAERFGKDRDYYKKLINYVKDRPGHDRRYAINCNKLKNSLKWKQSVDFSKGLDLTLDWYLNNREWSDHVKSGEYMEWIEKNYTERETKGF